MKLKNFYLFFLLFSCYHIAANNLQVLSRSLVNLSDQLKRLEQQLNQLPTKPTIPLPTPTPTPVRIVKISPQFEQFYNLVEAYKKTKKSDPFLNKVDDLAKLLSQPDLRQLEQKKLFYSIANLPDWFAEDVAFELIKKDPEKFKNIIEIALKDEEISSIALSPDRKTIACTTYAKNEKSGKVFIFDLANKIKIMAWEVSKRSVRSVAFHPTQKIIATGDFDHTIKIFQYAPYKKDPLHILKGHTDDVTAVTFNHDGSLLASTADDADVLIWDTNSWQPVLTFEGKTKEGHKGWGHSVSFNSDGSLLASSALDGSVKVWDLNTGQLLKTFVSGVERKKFERKFVFACGLFHPTDPAKLLIALETPKSVQKGTVQFYSIKKNEFTMVKNFPYDLEGAISLAFDPKKEKIAARDPFGHIVIWQIDTTKKLGEIGILSPSFCSAIFDNTGNQIITGYAPRLATLVFWKTFNIPSPRALLKKLVEKMVE